MHSLGALMLQIFITVKDKIHGHKLLIFTAIHVNEFFLILRNIIIEAVLFTNAKVLEAHPVFFHAFQNCVRQFFFMVFVNIIEEPDSRLHMPLIRHWELLELRHTILLGLIILIEISVNNAVFLCFIQNGLHLLKNIIYKLSGAWMHDLFFTVLLVPIKYLVEFFVAPAE